MGNLFKVNGIKIWFEEFGQPSNETILLIMGANANCKQWPQEFIDELVSKNFRVIASCRNSSSIEVSLVRFSD